MYEKIKPIQGSLTYTSKLRELGFRLVYVTFRSFPHSGRKFEWLNRNGFEVEDKDYIEVNDKSLVRGDYIIDDNFDNVRGFKQVGILYTQPWNKNERYYQRVSTWKELYELIVEREVTRGWMKTLSRPKEKSQK
jgi:5'(3')-deoxyribonucleotidase